MSTTAPSPGQPWQPAPPHPSQQPAPGYAQPVYQPAQPASSAAPASDRVSNPSVLHRWPSWAQNTAIAVGAVAVLVVVFFAGYFTANAVVGPHHGLGTNQDFAPRPFGGNGNGFGGQSGSGS